MYITLVLCKHNKHSSDTYLFQAPAWRTFREGDEVMVEAKDDIKRAFVVDYMSCNPESDEFRFAVKACHATLPLKRVISRVEYREFKYPEAENGSDNV